MSNLSVPDQLGASVSTLKEQMRIAMPGLHEDKLQELAEAARKHNLKTADEKWDQTMKDTKAQPNVPTAPPRPGGNGISLRQQAQGDQVKHLRIVITQEPPTWPQMLRSYLIAKLPHIFGIRASKKVIAARRHTCTDGPCQFLKTAPSHPGLYCGACGCAPTSDSNLARKTTMLWAKCPQKKWEN